MAKTHCAQQSRRQNEAMDSERKRRAFGLISFALHAARGLIRDQSARRWAMFIVLIASMILLFGGTTFFQAFLSPAEHPIWFIFYWIACGWLTFTALLLAVFDLLIVRLQGRAAGRNLREKLKDE